MPKTSSNRGGVTNLKPFPPGTSGNPGGRPRGVRSLIQARVGENAERLVDFLLLIGLGSDTKVKRTLGTTHAPRSQDRMRAVAELLDRGFGKAVQEVVLEPSNGLTVAEQERVKEFNDEQLAEFAVALDTVNRLLHGEA